MLPKNLFPAIRPLYDNIAAGQVCELGFRTLTGSAVSEKRAHQDIRDELFHDHGIKALKGAWTPHTIALRCLSAMAGHSFTYQLPGGIRLLGSPSPQLFYMVIDQALSEDDMLTAIGHVLSQLPHVDQPSP